MPQNEQSGYGHHGCDGRRKFETHDETGHKFYPLSGLSTLTAIFSRLFTFTQI
jgi:hypothetical protein